MEPGNREAFGRLTHEMSNALAYVVTNLNLLTEAVENDRQDEARRLETLIADALEGSERMGALLRSIRELSWGEGSAPDIGDVQDTDPPAHARRILVIDDEAAILSAVKRALRPHVVEVASSGEDALARIADACTYDLILCDLIMGGMSGIDVHKRLSEVAPTQASKLVFMTAGGFTPQMRSFLAHVDNSILHKPFDVKTLRWMVAQKLTEHSADAG